MYWNSDEHKDEGKAPQRLLLCPSSSVVIFILMMNRKNFLLVGILIIFCLSLFRTAQQISAGKKRLSEVKNEVDRTIKQKAALEKEIKERESLTFLETEARNQLNLIKPGERIVILPKKADLSSSSIGNSEDATQDQQKSSGPNWLKWKRLFFD